MVFNAQGVRSIDEDAGMLGGNDGLYDCGQVVYVGESLHTEEDIVEGALIATASIFWCADHCSTALAEILFIEVEKSAPFRGLKRSFPNVADLRKGQLHAFVRQGESMVGRT